MFPDELCQHYAELKGVFRLDIHVSGVYPGQENFASDPCELAFICVLLAITCVPINAFMISSMCVITYECELNLLTRLPQTFLDPYEA